MAQPKQLDDTIARITEREGLAERLESTTGGLGRAQRRRDSLQRSLITARERVVNLRDTVAKDKERGEHSAFAPQLEQEQEELRRMERERDEARALCERLSAEREELLQELIEGDEGATVECLSDHFAQVQAAERRVADIRSQLAEREAAATSDDMDDAEQRLEALQRQREEILADVALGTKQEKELDGIDAEIAALISDEGGTQSEALERWRRERQTIAGLERRLEAAEADLERLKALTPKLVDQYLISEANAAAKQYRRHAEELIQAFERLVVIEKLLGATGERPGNVIFHDKIRDQLLNLPMLKLKAMEGLVPHDKRVLYMSHLAAESTAKAEAKERDRLRELVGFEA